MPLANVVNRTNTKDVFLLIQDLLFKAGICSSPPEILHYCTLALLFICRICLVIQIQVKKKLALKNLLAFCNETAAFCLHYDSGFANVVKVLLSYSAALPSLTSIHAGCISVQISHYINCLIPPVICDRG